MRVRLIIGALMTSFMLSGCASVYNITSEQSDIIAEYAASVLCKNAFENKKEYIELKTHLAMQEEKEEQQEQEKPTQGEEPTQPDNVDTINPAERDEAGNISSSGAASNSSISQVLGLGNVDVVCLGYEVTDVYPKDEFALSTTATANHSLVVVSYQITNNSGEDVILSVEDGVSVKAVINDSNTVRAYMTMLNEDIANMDGKQLLAGESVTGVFVFNVKNELCSNISQLDVIANK